jgi:hypothetical protein
VRTAIRCSRSHWRLLEVLHASTAGTCAPPAAPPKGGAVPSTSIQDRFARAFEAAASKGPEANVYQVVIQLEQVEDGRDPFRSWLNE